MKLISLNTFGAAQGQIFFDFISGLAPEVDIFCFQEIFSAKEPAPKTNIGWHMYLLDELKQLLPEFVSYFDVKSSGYADDGQEKVSFPVEHGIAVFLKKNIKVLNKIVETLGDSVGSGAPAVEGIVNAQLFTLEAVGKKFNLVNTHGMSRPGHKLDSPQRLEQSENLLKAIGSLPEHPLILAGDFNLMPDTESIKLFERAGYSNLIKQFNITNTRNEISWKQYNDKQSYADFIFTSPKIKINNFEVPYNLVSDHLPMILEFELS